MKDNLSLCFVREYTKSKTTHTSVLFLSGHAQTNLKGNSVDLQLLVLNCILKFNITTTITFKDTQSRRIAGYAS